MIIAGASLVSFLFLEGQDLVPMMSCDLILIEHLPKLIISPEVYLQRLE